MKTILVVDDDVQFCDMVKEYLTHAGYDVHVAHDGEEAIDLIERLRPKAILLDILMPGREGIETLKDIRRIDPTASIFIVTAVSDDMMMSYCLKLGAKAYFKKPFELSQLGTVLAKTVSKSHPDRRSKKNLPPTTSG